MKVAHLSSAHNRYDTRIFLKMCKSLSKNYYKVYLVIADGKGDEINSGVSILDAGVNKGGRINRMTKTVSKIFKKAKELDVDIYHLHDPELIPIGLKLKKLGKKIIFDAHEDLPKQLLSKPYLNKFSKKILSKIFEIYERYSLPKFDAVVAATPDINDKLLKINTKTININNYPLLNELRNSHRWIEKKNEVIYLGFISKIRGITQLLSSLNYIKNIRLNLVGSFNDKNLEKDLKKSTNWKMVNEYGFLDRKKVNEVLANSKVGVVTFLPEPNHINAQPNKMFEYMSAGLPIVCSNFLLWKKIIENNDCGICVDPLNARDIGKAIQYVLDNPIKAEQMGKNGRKAVEQTYNWSIEEKKLLELYKNIVK
tara:strand:- start:151 stop:1254 length:1104 start_codon:yes stop_codon:yes gene_type:complete